MNGGPRSCRLGPVPQVGTKSHLLVVGLEDFVVEDVDRYGEGVHGWMMCRSLIRGNYIPDISKTDPLTPRCDSKSALTLIYRLNDTRLQLCLSTEVWKV